MSPRSDYAARSATTRVLLVQNRRGEADAIAAGLAACFAREPELEIATSGRDASDRLRAGTRDLVLADVAALADLSEQAEEAVARLARLSGEALTIALSDDGSVSSALAAMRAGAHDCLAKPIEAAVLASRLAALAMRHGKTLALKERVEGVTAAAASATPSVPAPPRPAVLPMWQQEQRIIEEAIASFGGNISLAAAALQLSPSTIYRKRQAWAEAAQERQGAA